LLQLEERLQSPPDGLQGCKRCPSPEVRQRALVELGGVVLVLAAGTRHTAERISGADGSGARLIVAVMVWMLGTLGTTVPFAEVSTPISVHPRLRA